jgi:hypothetical protein
MTRLSVSVLVLLFDITENQSLLDSGNRGGVVADVLAWQAESRTPD